MPHDRMCDCDECREMWDSHRLAVENDELRRALQDLGMRFDNVVQHMGVLYQLLSAVTRQPKPTWETMHELARHQLPRTTRTTFYGGGIGVWKGD